MTTDRAPTVDLSYIQAATGLKLQIAWSEGGGHHSFATRDHAHGWYNGKIWGWSVEPNPCKPECQHVFDGPPIDGMNAPSLQVKTGSEFPEGLNVVSSGDTGQVDDKPIVHRAGANPRHPCCGQWPQLTDVCSTVPAEVTCRGLGVLQNPPVVTVGAPQVPELDPTLPGRIRQAMAEYAYPDNSPAGLVAIEAQQARRIASAYDVPPSVVGVGAATHIAGPRVEIAGRVRQRCAWCGESLVDVARYQGSFILGVDLVPTFEQGAMVRLDPEGNNPIEVAGWLLPDDNCAGS